MATDLSESELRVLRLTAEGFDWREIAGRLFLSHHTVRSHQRSAKRKLGASNLPNLVYIAYQLGILTKKEAVS